MTPMARYSFYCKCGGYLRGSVPIQTLDDLRTKWRGLHTSSKCAPGTEKDCHTLRRALARAAAEESQPK